MKDSLNFPNVPNSNLAVDNNRFTVANSRVFAFHFTTTTECQLDHRPEYNTQEPVGRQGMPSALLSNASPPAMLKDKSREMEASETRKKELAICPTDDDAIAPKAKKPHKQSFDYIWRTGLAGGLAGSAVCTSLNLLKPLHNS
jgi:hypothetical protein